MNMITALLAGAAAALSAAPAASLSRAGDGPAAPQAARPASSHGTQPPVAPANAAGPAVAAEVHPWWSGAVYHVATAPERVTDIALQPGETLIAVAAGDTARWIIGDTASGSGPTRRTHILVKPAAAGLRTNVVIATDRRVYHLELESGGRAMTSISWTYPHDDLLALRREQNAPEPAVQAAPPVAVDRLNFDYAITGDSPAWRPVRAFDDGARVFIQFPAELGSLEAPPLFLTGASGRPELVNYRKRGVYYVVDRLFAAAELRLGGKRQQVVRITRNAGERRRARDGSAS